MGYNVANMPNTRQNTSACDRCVRRNTG
jgi:hypothetical protein